MTHTSEYPPSIKTENAVLVLFRWLHLRSLDAVLVGLVWQALFFRHWEVDWHWKYALILATAIWLAYMADRLFDLLSFDKSKPITRRHRFVQTNKKTILSIWGFLFVGIVVFSIFQLPGEIFAGGLWLVLLINSYFLLIRLARGIPFLGSLKEIITGTLFSVGVSYFPLLLLPYQSSSEYLDQILFAILCFSNVLLLSHWDHAIDKGQLENRLSQGNFDPKATLNLLLIGQCCLCMLNLVTRSGILGWALFLSAPLLWALYLESQRTETAHTKYLIDAPLIFPIILLVAVWKW